ncbi:hypothetical protein LCGC14_2050460, partial [marine sediment metagenome]
GIEALQGEYPIFPHRELAWAIAKAQDIKNKAHYQRRMKVAIASERERIHAYIEVLVKSGELKINDGVLLWDIIQNVEKR